jgi:hypothetical protein
LSIKKTVKKQFAKVNIKVKPLNKHKTSESMVTTSMANIVLFFYCTSSKEIINIGKFLDKIDDSFNIGAVLVYADIDKIENEIIHDRIKIFNIDNFNIVGSLKQNTSDWLSSNIFDILISFADNCDLFCNRIINNISAEFKAGSFNEQNLELFDLTLVNTTDEYHKKFEYYIHYINNLNINT